LPEQITQSIGECCSCMKYLSIQHRELPPEEFETQQFA
jgi:hypothetical protein